VIKITKKKGKYVRIPKFDLPKGKRKSIIGTYQPRKGASIEHYYGYSKEGIYDQAHRIHGRINVKKFKFRFGKYKD